MSMAQVSAVLAQFLNLVRSDSEIQLALMGIGSPEDACEVARGKGFAISPAEFSSWRDARLAELQDEELNVDDLTEVVGGLSSLSQTTINVSSTSLNLNFLPGDMFRFMKIIAV